MENFFSTLNPGTGVKSELIHHVRFQTRAGPNTYAHDANCYERHPVHSNDQYPGRFQHPATENHVPQGDETEWREAASR